MPAPSLWGEGLWDEARWSYVEINGDVGAGPDLTDCGVAVINPVGGLALEDEDGVLGTVTTIVPVAGEAVGADDAPSGEVLAAHAVSGDISGRGDVASGTAGVFNFISAAVTNAQDVTSGAINQIIRLSGKVSNGGDAVSSVVSFIYGVFGNVANKSDEADGQIGIIVTLHGAITEDRDLVRGNFSGPLGVRKGGGWVPQFHYKREWEIEPEVIEEIYEPDPEALFIPTALPIDPAVARMIDVMLRGPEPVDTDDDDIESLLMNL